MLKNFLLFALSIALVLTLTSCEEETTNPPEPPVAPNAPTDLMATSIDAQTVKLKWTAPAAGQTPTGYVISIVDENDAKIDRSVSGAATTTAAIDGLTEGMIYEFTVRAVNDTARSAPTSTIMWSPATRTTTTLLLYETASDLGSGIELPSDAGLTIATGGRWDLCLDTRDELFDIGSPRVSSYTNTENPPKFPNGETARLTLIGLAWTDVASLDDIYESADLVTVSGGTGSLTETLIRFNDANTQGKPFAFVVKTENGNFAKVLVKASGGKLLQGTAPDRYVELEVSYQSEIDVPYAGVDQTRWTTKKHAGGTVSIREHKLD